MRLTLVAILLFPVAGYAPAAHGAAAKSPVEGVIDSLFRVHQLSGVAMSPDGSHVAWVESREDPVSGAATLSIYTANPADPASSIRRITAGDGAREHHEHDLA